MQKILTDLNNNKLSRDKDFQDLYKLCKEIKSDIKSSSIDINIISPSISNRAANEAIAQIDRLVRLAKVIQKTRKDVEELDLQIDVITTVSLSDDEEEKNVAVDSTDIRKMQFRGDDSDAVSESEDD